MDIMTHIKARKSIRHFTADVPSRKLILECLEGASWAPNPTSQQPWKFIVLTDASLKTVCQVIEENSRTHGRMPSACFKRGYGTGS